MMSLEKMILNGSFDFTEYAQMSVQTYKSWIVASLAKTEHVQNISVHPIEQFISVSIWFCFNFPSLFNLYLWAFHFEMCLGCGDMSSVCSGGDWRSVLRFCLLLLTNPVMSLLCAFLTVWCDGPPRTKGFNAVYTRPPTASWSTSSTSVWG